MNVEEWLTVLLVSCSPLSVVHLITSGISSLPLYLAAQVSAIPGG